MNLEAVRVVKISKVEGDNKPKSNEDKDESFLKSLNDLLEKNNIKVIKDEKESRGQKKDNKEEDSFNYLAVLNTETLITNKYPDETSLNIGSSSELSINLEEVDGLSQAELQNLNLLQEGLVDYSKEKVQVIPEDFKLEETEVKLDKLLDREALIEGKLLILLDGLIKPETIAGLEEGTSSKAVGTINSDKKEAQPQKKSIKPDSGNNLVKAVEDNLRTNELSFNSLLEEAVENIGSEEEIEELVDSNTIESTKSLETNFILERIQNSLLNMQKVEEGISPENLKTIQDSMIHFMEVSKEGDTSIVKVRLYPEELGSMDITLKFQDGKLLADIVVQSEKVKEMFLNGSNLLNKNLLDQNIPIKNINISVNKNLNNFENKSMDSSQDGSRQSDQRGILKRNKNEVLTNGPIDNIRINRINKNNSGLNILV